MITLLNISTPSFDNTTLLSLGILCAPFFIFCFLILFGRIVNRYRGILATTVMFFSMIAAFSIFSNTWGLKAHHGQIEWFNIGGKIFTLGIYIDNITALMLSMVTLISFLVHLFSIEYLRGDRHFEKYFAYLNLFTFAMLGILLSDNLFLIFIFWELVGFSSYLLIGFWFEKESAASASKKAFLTNKVGDAGFLLGLLILWTTYGTLDLQSLYTHIQQTDFSQGSFVISETWLIVAGFGLFLGCVGKSAQFPLQVWLPNAMEGPTPVSALIHAATMVAAGVYLLSRIFLLLHVDVLTVIACIGAITAFMGAFAAMAQTDVKRVLAFSTISQLGYMVMAMGVGAYDAALFHLLTHAFFKACLFLGAGSVIFSMHELELKTHIDFDPQDMRLMGGLRKKKFTFVTYTIATLSLVGIPFFSGFLSKDAILLGTWAWADIHSQSTMSWYYLIPFTAFLTVFLTAFYMGRQWLLVFMGDLRLEKKVEGYKDALKNLDRAPLLMRIAMVILGILSFGVIFSLNPFSISQSWFHQNIVTPITGNVNTGISADFVEKLNHVAHSYHTMGAILSVGLVMIGLGLAYLLYGNEKETALKNMHNKLFHENSFLYKLSYHNWFLDEIYEATVINLVLFKSFVFNLVDQYVINVVVDSSAKLTLKKASVLMWIDNNVLDRMINYIGYSQVIFAAFIGWFDKRIVDGLVGLVGGISLFVGRFTRSFQGGKIQSYLISSLIITIVLVVIILLSIK